MRVKGPEPALSFFSLSPGSGSRRWAPKWAKTCDNVSSRMTRDGQHTLQVHCTLKPTKTSLRFGQILVALISPSYFNYLLLLLLFKLKCLRGRSTWLIHFHLQWHGFPFAFLAFSL